MKKLAKRKTRADADAFVAEMTAAQGGEYNREETDNKWFPFVIYQVDDAVVAEKVCVYCDTTENVVYETTPGSTCGTCHARIRARITETEAVPAMRLTEWEAREGYDGAE